MKGEEKKTSLETLQNIWDPISHFRGGIQEKRMAPQLIHAFNIPLCIVGIHGDEMLNSVDVSSWISYGLNCLLRSINEGRIRLKELEETGEEDNTCEIISRMNLRPH